MIAQARTFTLPIATLKRIMSDRRLDNREKTTMVALLHAFADTDGRITIPERELCTWLELCPRGLRLNLGALWANGYITELGQPEPGGPLHITLRNEYSERSVS